MRKYSDSYAIVYPALGLSGEAGEISEKVKKWVRDEGGPRISTQWEGKPQLPAKGMSEERRQALLLELGDPLWYIGALADDLGFTLQEVVDANVSKLTSRKTRGVIHGDGDNR
jgi:NTP pyrophosphatase (non-canonical NTP hydrolase)